MSITSMTYTVRGPVAHRKIVYHALLESGAVINYSMYSADPSFDPDTITSLIQAKLEQQLETDEIDAWLTQALLGAGPAMVHASRLKYLSRWRARFKESVGSEAWRLAAHMKTAIDAGHFTNVQLRNAWNVTPVQLTAFLTRLETRQLAWIYLEDEKGE